MRGWYWFNPKANEWVKVPSGNSSFIEGELPNSVKLEKEYQADLKGVRMGQYVYHCFGDGGSACADFEKMETYCSSAKCMLTHQQRGVANDHQSFKLKRIGLD